MKRILRLLPALALLAVPSAHAFVDLADCPAGNPSFDIVHTQSTLGTESLLTCPFDSTPTPHTFITRIFHITNGTGTPWTDYHFDVALGDPQSAVGAFGWDSAHPTGVKVGGSAGGASVVFAGTEVSLYFLQPLVDAKGFQVELRFGEYNGSTATVTGTPSVPEPATLALLGLGLGGLGFARRRATR